MTDFRDACCRQFEEAGLPNKSNILPDLSIIGPGHKMQMHCLTFSISHLFLGVYLFEYFFL